MAKRRKMTTARSHPLVGRYASVYLCRTERTRDGNIAGHYGGIIREVDVGQRVGLRRVVIQRPSSLTASTFSARCRGDCLYVTDERELDRVQVQLRSKRMVPLRELLADMEAQA